MRLKITCLMLFLLPCLAVAQRYSADGDTLYLGDHLIIKNNRPVINSVAPSNKTEKAVTTGTWGDEVRLTYLSNTDSTSSVFISQAGVARDTAVLAFICGMRYPWEGSMDFLMKSTDFGQNWSQPYRYRDSSSVDLFVDDIYIDRSNLCLGGIIRPGTSIGYIPFFQQSSGLDYVWDEPYYFFDLIETTVISCGMGRLADTLYFLYYVGFTQLHGDVDSIFISRSYNNGQSWTTPQSVVHWLAAGDLQTFFEISGNVFNIVYQEMKPGNGNSVEIYQSISTDYGHNWETRSVSGEDSIHSQMPWLSQESDGELVATWYDYKYGGGPSGFTGDILGRASIDGGLTWGPEFCLTRQHMATLSTCLINNGHIVVVWLDHSHGLISMELHTAESSDCGLTWTDELNLSPSPHYRYSITLKASYPKALLFWDDSQPVDSIYYQDEVFVMRYEAATSINDNPTIQPSQSPLEITCYPNPFNGTAVIEFQSSFRGMADCKIYNILGQQIYSYDRFNLVVGKNTINWDGTNNKHEKVTSGAYFIRVESKGENATAIISIMK